LALCERIETFRKIDEAFKRPQEPLVGRTLRHYRVVEQLGTGGMGEVYRAEDLLLGRQVALKVLPPQHARDSGRRARFESEARFLASLDHPNIAAIHSVERCEDLDFLVLELVPGETLASRLARGPLSLEAARPVSCDIGRALEAVHGQGIIHRDLKPANIVITPGGRAKLLDFSLSKSCAAEGSERPRHSISPNPVTASGVILGTATYMSPEQARGKAIDRRTDIWSFGCVFFEALTGRPAFAGETLSDTVANVLTGSPDWDLLPAATPPKWRRMMRRCLEKDPGKRPASMVGLCSM
jgi:serine/threonine-protein kinase